MVGSARFHYSSLPRPAQCFRTHWPPPAGCTRSKKGVISCYSPGEGREYVVQLYSQPGFAPATVAVGTVRLADGVGVEAAATTCWPFKQQQPDLNGDGVPDVMCWFVRADVIGALPGQGPQTLVLTANFGSAGQFNLPATDAINGISC